jgi:hypothetical protein
MNEAYIEVPKVRWSDIAGSENVKAKLWEAVDLPLKVSTFCQDHGLSSKESWRVGFQQKHSSAFVVFDTLLIALRLDLARSTQYIE